MIKKLKIINREKNFGKNFVILVDFGKFFGWVRL